MTRPLIVLLGLCLATPALAEGIGVPLKDGVPHMVTSGEASLDVLPDQADMGLALSVERKSADEATDAAAKATEAVVAALTARGVEAGDIHTSLDLARIFEVRKDEADRGGRTASGWEAGVHVAVRLHDLATVAVLARDLARSSTAAIASIAYSYSKEAQRRRDLDAEAMRDALQQAKVYTDAIGLKLGPVLEIAQDPISARQTFRASSGADFGHAAGSLALPIAPGPLRLREAVTVVWQIEGRAH